MTVTYFSTVSRPISHSLPPELESGLFGSPVDGSCSSTSGTNNEICDGTSVLNDGILPALSGVSSDSQSLWAAQLLTMRRSGIADMTISQVSCDHLWKLCVELGGAGIPNLNLVFPYQNNSDFVFLGEVTFLNDGNNNQCDPPELITMQVIPQPSTGK